MGFANSMQSTGNVAIVAGAFDDLAAVVSGTGWSVKRAAEDWTITFDRQYDGVISIVATVLNGGVAPGESSIAVIKSHAVTGDADGGNFVLNLCDDAGNIQGSFQTDVEVHFIAILLEDTDPTA